MSNNGETVYRAALNLTPSERAELIERLITSLDPPSQKTIDALWAEEAEDRLAAYERGEMYTIPGEEVFREITKLRNEKF